MKGLNVSRRTVVKMLAVTPAAYMLAGCGSSGSSTQAASGSSKGGATNIKWAKDNSGNTFLAIAEKKGWLEDEGITIEEAPFDENKAALTALAGNQVDVISNYGTDGPLQEIASGEDFIIIGGYMAQGCMPIIAKAGTKWNGVEDLLGKKVACQPTVFPVTGKLLELGHDPLTEVEWVSYPNYSDSVAAVVQGECDYAIVGTSRNYEVNKNKDLAVMAYKSDIMPYYSCCRMVVKKDYLDKNRDTLVKVMTQLIRAEEYYGKNHDECVQLMKDYMGVELDYVKSYMDNSHFIISNDPLRNAVINAWDILGKTGFLSDTANSINIDDHIDTTVYEEALKNATDKYGSEDPDFYSERVTFFQEHDA